jgi:hypothetical protein
MSVNENRPLWRRRVSSHPKATSGLGNNGWRRRTTCTASNPRRYNPPQGRLLCAFPAFSSCRSWHRPASRRWPRNRLKVKYGRRFNPRLKSPVARRSFSYSSLKQTSLGRTVLESSGFRLPRRFLCQSSPSRARPATSSRPSTSLASRQAQMRSNLPESRPASRPPSFK